MTAAPSTSTDLAFERTRLARERTLMAWVRTATSLISFGFTIYKFFDYLGDQPQFTAATGKLFGPRTFAIAMILTGLVSLIVATVEHRGSRKMFSPPGGQPPRSLALIVASLVACLGVLGLFLVVFRQ